MGSFKSTTPDSKPVAENKKDTQTSKYISRKKRFFLFDILLNPHILSNYLSLNTNTFLILSRVSRLYAIKLESRGIVYMIKHVKTVINAHMDIWWLNLLLKLCCECQAIYTIKYPIY